MSDFDGFPRAALQFLAELRANNNRAWFHENRGRAEEFLLAPARELVTAVGERLRAKRPGIVADPRTDRSIYRLNRDTRFSRDKTPYKTHLAVWWWEGVEGRLECPGFYFHLSPDSLGLSFGCYRFSERGLAGWRTALSDKRTASRFRILMRDLEKNGHQAAEPELKRIPAGLSLEQPLAPWLRHKGLYTWREDFPPPPEIFAPGAADFIYRRFEAGLALHGWLVKALGGLKTES
ncbi:MAG: DUF2461 domain-containing protein [Candidatus Adiutrix sp.]|jgi:uncharacterized protein (TIGR02453 family)|nr:DUF2461 domain-containing protein [Candidatus Adiutrix sp.]